MSDINKKEIAEKRLLELLKLRLDEAYVISFRCNPTDPSYFAKERKEYFYVMCKFAITEDLSKIALLVSVKVSPDDQRETELIFLEAQVSYSVENLKECLEGDALNIPKKFYGAIITRAVGMLRGILLSKVADTIYAPILLPLISIDSLIPTEPIRLSEIEEQNLVKTTQQPKD